MAEAMPNGSKCFVRLLGRFLVPTIPYEHTFLLDLARRVVDALWGSGAIVIYVGGADSLAAVQEVLSIGCTAVQLGRPLLREPFFVRKLEAAARLQVTTARPGPGPGQRADTTGAISEAAPIRAGAEGQEVAAQEQGGPIPGRVQPHCRSSAQADWDGASLCTRCNQCTLASIDPVRFKAGCPLLKPGEGRRFGDVADIESLAFGVGRHVLW